MRKKQQKYKQTKKKPKKYAPHPPPDPKGIIIRDV